jgi:hypothetical protein
MKIRQVALGIATYIPGILTLDRMRKQTGGTDSARYCYSVWLRHLVLANRNGFCRGSPRVVAEIGPGDSIGIGIAALLSGSDEYFGLDIVRYANLKRNLGVFDELVELFRNRTDIPDDPALADVKPQLSSYAFPDNILPDTHLARCLSHDRIERIRASISEPDASGSMIRYAAPWFTDASVQHGSVDMIFSQAVLEHVDDISAAYRSMAAWLSKNGFMSHQIDFRSHGTAAAWDGHWACPDMLWKVIRGRRPFLLNRDPFSAHEQAVRKLGFDVIHSMKVHSHPSIRRTNLASGLPPFTDEDLHTSGAFLQACRGHTLATPTHA